MRLPDQAYERLHFCVEALRTTEVVIHGEIN